MKIIDIHVHAFPDAIAERAVPQLEAEGHVQAALDGKVSSLLRSMDQAGIQKAVLCNIATKPEQFPSILKWSASVASDRLIPLPSIHPNDPDPAGKVDAVKAAGLKGIKLHPYYQKFILDDGRMFPLYARLEEQGMLLIAHSGFDFAFPRDRIGDPVRTMNVLRRFPKLKLVTTHLGAWEDWDEVRRHILGRPVYMDVSCSFDFMTPADARDLLLKHPAEYLLFGSDSPWVDQAKTIAQLRALELGEDRLERLLWRNAEALLASA